MLPGIIPCTLLEQENDILSIVITSDPGTKNMNIQKISDNIMEEIMKNIFFDQEILHRSDHLRILSTTLTTAIKENIREKIIDAITIRIIFENDTDQNGGYQKKYIIEKFMAGSSAN